MCPGWTSRKWRAQGDDLRTFLAELVSNAASCLEALNHTQFDSLVSAGSTTEAFHKKEDVGEFSQALQER